MLCSLVLVARSIQFVDWNLPHLLLPWAGVVRGAQTARRGDAADAPRGNGVGSIDQWSVKDTLVTPFPPFSYRWRWRRSAGSVSKLTIVWSSNL